jgi:hypothetical protein
MDKLAWIASIVATLVAIVGAFVGIPEMASILIVLGIVAALDIEEDRRLPLMVATLVLLAAGGQIEGLIAIGGYLGDILANMAVAYSAASLTVIVLALADRLMSGGSSD